MFDRNTSTLAIRSRTARSAGLTMAGFVVAALAFFVASPASADHRHSERGHYVGCRDHAHHYGPGHHYHLRHHYRHSGWHSGFGFGLFLPHFELRLDRPHRARRSHSDRHHVRDRKHRDRKHRDRKHRDRKHNRDHRS